MREGGKFRIVSGRARALAALRAGMSLEIHADPKDPELWLVRFKAQRR